MKTTARATGLFSTNANVPGVRRCLTCGRFASMRGRIDTETDDGSIESFCARCYGVPQPTSRPVSRRSLAFLPRSVNFSRIEQGGEDVEEPVEFGQEDQGLIEAGKEMTLIHILRILPKDSYRVIALMLYLRELGFTFRYEDIASIWGYRNKEVVGNKIKRIQSALRRAGVNESGVSLR